MRRAEPPDLPARVRGCLLAGAAGDAYGAPCEGGGVPSDHDTRELRVTDDTQLTLATCESIVERGEVDPAEIAGRFGELFRASTLRGLGASTYKALSELAAGGHWALVGAVGERSAGNGAAMRIAPLAFCLDPTDFDERRTIRDVSRITHRHDEAYVGALALVFAIRAALDGTWTGRERLTSLAARRLPDTLVRDRLRALAEEDEAAPLEGVAARYGASGYVVESLPLAILAAERVPALGFAETLRQLAHLGGDADTLCSLTGQISGALLGDAVVPEGLFARVEERAAILAAATRFAEWVSG